MAASGWPANQPRLLTVWRWLARKSDLNSNSSEGAASGRPKGGTGHKERCVRGGVARNLCRKRRARFQSITTCTAAAAAEAAARQRDGASLLTRLAPAAMSVRNWPSPPFVSRGALDTPPPQNPSRLRRSQRGGAQCCLCFDGCGGGARRSDERTDGRRARGRQLAGAVAALAAAQQPPNDSKWRNSRIRLEFCASAASASGKQGRRFRQKRLRAARHDDAKRRSNCAALAAASPSDQPLSLLSPARRPPPFSRPAPSQRERRQV